MFKVIVERRSFSALNIEQSEIMNMLTKFQTQMNTINLSNNPLIIEKSGSNQIVEEDKDNNVRKVNPQIIGTEGNIQASLVNQLKNETDTLIPEHETTLLQNSNNDPLLLETTEDPEYFSSINQFRDYKSLKLDQLLKSVESLKSLKVDKMKLTEVQNKIMETFNDHMKEIKSIKERLKDNEIQHKQFGLKYTELSTNIKDIFKFVYYSLKYQIEDIKNIITENKYGIKTIFNKLNEKADKCDIVMTKQFMSEYYFCNIGTSKRLKNFQKM